ncbi:MAG TPA: hypothetical protein VHS80_11330 [Chthoniobacterales bacterium]|jgi:hypothetical protein|nr:hypothetical protein [Chthoniobacterales bacterium]
MSDKVENVFPDKPDLRDRTYAPTLHALPKSHTTDLVFQPIQQGIKPD